MPRTLTAADRSALIRLASTLEKGSPERKAILAGLGKMAYGWSRSEKELGRKAMAELGLTQGQMYALLDSMGAMSAHNKSLRDGDGEKPMKGKRDWIAMSMTDGLVRPLGRKTLGRFYDIVYGDRRRAGLEKMARMPSMVLNDPKAYLRWARKTWEYNVNNPRLKFDAAVEKTRKKNRLPDTPEGRAEAAYHEITLLQD